LIQSSGQEQRSNPESENGYEIMITYHSVVLMCSDITASRVFYQNLFHLEIELDIEGLVSFKEGISLWSQKIASDLMYQGSAPSPAQAHPNQEIYFETDDIEGFFEKIQKESIKLLHPIQLTPWQQRTVRFYDPDGHLIEVGESMQDVIKRLGGDGKTSDEIAELTMMPGHIITAILSGTKP